MRDTTKDQRDRALGQDRTHSTTRGIIQAGVKPETIRTTGETNTKTAQMKHRIKSNATDLGLERQMLDINED